MDRKPIEAVAYGKLLSPLYLVLKKSSGLSDQEYKKIYSGHLIIIPNVYVSASKSDKLTADHFKIDLSHLGLRWVLFLDSWSGYCPMFYNILFLMKKR